MIGNVLYIVILISDTELIILKLEIPESVILVFFINLR